MRPIQTEFNEIFQKVSKITLLVFWPHLVWGRWKQDTYVLKVSQCQEDTTMDKYRTQWETPTRWPRIPLHWIKEGLRHQWNRQWNRLWRQIIPWLPRFRLFQGLSYGFPWSWTQKKRVSMYLWWTVSDHYIWVTTWKGCVSKTAAATMYTDSSQREIVALSNPGGTNFLDTLFPQWWSWMPDSGTQVVHW